MRQYLDLVKDILHSNGIYSEADVERVRPRPDRTGVGTYSVFGRQMRFNLAEGFPVLTTKRLHIRSIIYELLWFLRGDTNIRYLNENKVTIWDEWADEHGELGPIYGKQWRRWEAKDGRTIDQIKRAIDLIKKDPTSRRIIVNAWNVGELDEMALTPCHTLFQLYVDDDKLSLLMYQRSADVMLGVPFNIASYSLLLMMIAQVTGLRAHEFIHTLGDAHIYSNHVQGALEQIKREPLPLPTMRINPSKKDIDEFDYEDFELIGYQAHEHIKFDIAV